MNIDGTKLVQSSMAHTNGLSILTSYNMDVINDIAAIETNTKVDVEEEKVIEPPLGHLHVFANSSSWAFPDSQAAFVRLVTLSAKSVQSSLSSPVALLFGQSVQLGLVSGHPQRNANA